MEASGEELRQDDSLRSRSVWQLKPELIPDRSLGPEDADEFAHDDYVEQLAALIDSRPNTANVALFGSWGAGKSGIARRLRERCKNKDGIKYAEFNA